MGRVLTGLTVPSQALATAFGGAPGIAATVGLSGTALGVLLFQLPVGASRVLDVRRCRRRHLCNRKTNRKTSEPGHSPPGLLNACNKVKSERQLLWVAYLPA